MEPKVTLLTSTGFRPEAFKLCREYMFEQTFKGEVVWLIVNDSLSEERDSDFLPNWTIQYIDPPKIWKEGINTQRLNLDAMIPYTFGDYIFVIEDDDYYSPNYLETMIKLLKIFPVVGEGNAKYYYWPAKCYREMENHIHASLCQTGFRSELLPLFEIAINSGHLYFDVEFWRLIKEKKLPHLLFQDLNLSVGLKGLPGRMGIGTGHTPIGYKSDPTMKKLTDWIGKDGVDKYKKIFNNGIYNFKSSETK